jgi:hypothetical protein
MQKCNELSKLSRECNEKIDAVTREKNEKLEAMAR